MKLFPAIAWVCLAVALAGTALYFIRTDIFRSADSIQARKVKTETKDTVMSYHIEGAYTRFKYVSIEVRGNGTGTVAYALYPEYVPKEKGAQAEQRTDIRLSTDTVRQLALQYDTMGFKRMHVRDLNKRRMNVTDVGTTTLTYAAEGTEWILTYGFVEDKRIAKLVGMYGQLLVSCLPQQREKSPL